MSPSPLPPEAELLERAAELRAAGSSWDVVARKLGTTADALRGLTRTHKPKYRKLLAAARREVVDESFCEGMLILRAQARLEDLRIANKAADALVRVRMGMVR